MKVFKHFELEKHTDERGEIINILPENMDVKSALFISGNPGSVRGEHYHKTDVHYCYVLHGSILYEAKNRQTGEVTSVLLGPGDIIANEGDELHRFVFKTKGSFIALAKNPRDQESYEQDTVRESF